MFGDYNRIQEVLHGEFNIETHKEVFKNYLEVVIDAAGGVHYAVPSHQEYAIRVLLECKYASREALDAAVPRDYWFRMMEWLMLETNFVFIWTDRYMGNLNDAQRKTLWQLKEEGLFTGEID